MNAYPEATRGGLESPLGTKAYAVYGGPGAYLAELSKHDPLASATTATTLLSSYTPASRLSHSRSSIFPSPQTSISIAPSLFHPPSIPPALNRRRLLPIGAPTRPQSMHETPHHLAPSPAHKGVGLDPDALNRLPSLQPGTAQEERTRRNQAKQHMRDNTLPKVLARADAVKKSPPTAGAADTTNTTDINKSTPSSSSGGAHRAGHSEPSGSRPPRATTQTPRAKRVDAAVKCTTTPCGWGSPFSPDALKHMADAAPSADTGTGAALLTTTMGSHTGTRNAIARNLDEAERFAQLTVKLRDMGDKARSRNYEKDGTMQERYAQVSGHMFSSVDACSRP